MLRTRGLTSQIEPETNKDQSPLNNRSNKHLKSPIALTPPPDLTLINESKESTLDDYKCGNLRAAAATADLPQIDMQRYGVKHSQHLLLESLGDDFIQVLE